MSAVVLAFDPAAHAYTVAGQRIPSVTEILKWCRVSTDFDALPNREAIERARDRGTALHADAHALDDGDLDWSTVHDEVKPYLQAWEAFKADKAAKPLSRERRVYDRVLNVAGTLDGIFEVYLSQVPVLIDLKTGDPASAAAQYQTAAYLLAYASDYPEAMGYRRWSVQLTPSLRVPYRVTEYSDFRDFDTWRAIVATFYASSARRAL